MGLKAKSRFRELWIYVSPRRRMQLAILLGLMVIASFAEVVSIGAVLPFLAVLMDSDNLFAGSLIESIGYSLNLTNKKQLLILITSLFVVAAIFSGGMRLLLLWAQTRLSYAIGADLSIDTYRKTLFQPYEVHLARNSSQVIAGISGKCSTVVHNALLPVLTILSSCLILITILVSLIVIDPAVAFVTFLGFAIIYAVIMFSTKKRLAQASWNSSKESAKVIKALQEGLGGIRDVLIDGTQSTYCNIYRKADLALRKSQADILIIGGAPRYLIETLGIVLLAVLAFGLAVREGGIGAAIPILGALAIGAQRLLPVLQQFYASWSALRGGQDSLADVLDLLGQPLPEYLKQAERFIVPFERSIRLSKVGYRYASDGLWVLKNVDLEIPRGARVGVIGTTGSGKSTLVDVLMGLLEPSMGFLEIDGVPITRQNQRGWQAHIAHVPQAIFLSDSSIAENIAFGVPIEEIDFEAVRRAAHRAQIGQTIESWSRQYHTFVGERGVRLSGGQRQRIGIARAFYKQSDVIVFDEATSALDVDTERAVMESVQIITRDITLIMVAHRLSTLQSCDFVIELESGSVKRIGVYSEMVLESNGKTEHR